MLLEVEDRLEEARAGNADEGTLAQREKACAEALARKDVQRELGRLLVSLSEGILAWAAAARAAAWSDGGAGNLAEEASLARFWERWKEALAEGLDSKEIAERLHISVKTEANHMTRILNKLGVHSRLQALVFAVRHSVIEIH